MLKTVEKTITTLPCLSGRNTKSPRLFGLCNSEFTLTPPELQQEPTPTTYSLRTSQNTNDLHSLTVNADAHFEFHLCGDVQT